MKVQRVLYLIGVLHLFGAAVSWMAQAPLAALVGSIFSIFLAGLYFGAGLVARRRPLVAVYVGGVVFALVQILLPLLLNPATLLMGVFGKVLQGALLVFAWQSARSLAHVPRLVADD